MGLSRSGIIASVVLLHTVMLGSERWSYIVYLRERERVDLSKFPGGFFHTAETTAGDISPTWGYYNGSQVTTTGWPRSG